MIDQNADRAPRPVATRPRGFGVYDWMVAIAGIAVLPLETPKIMLNLVEQIKGMFVYSFAYFGIIPSRPYGPPSIIAATMASYWRGALGYGVQAAARTVVIASVVVLLMRLRRPRPSIGALLAQPGAVAALAVPVGRVMVAGWLHVLFFGRLIDGTVTPIAVGGTVALAWTCLALSRKWHAEPSWVDRMGRALGVTAIMTGGIAYAAFGI